MLIDHEWVDDEEYVRAKLVELKNLREEVLALLVSGDVDDDVAHKAIKFINQMEYSNRAPDEYWDSSSAYC